MNMMVKMKLSKMRDSLARDITYMFNLTKIPNKKRKQRYTKNQMISLMLMLLMIKKSRMNKTEKTMSSKTMVSLAQDIIFSSKPKKNQMILLMPMQLTIKRSKMSGTARMMSFKTPVLPETGSKLAQK